jgi:pSer/pThr/pTyr-binding forkhead associated (FHA) protein/S1-C subfamily serine protease
MPRIVLKDLQNEKTVTVHDAEATFGRDPASSVVAESANSKVVSGSHCRLYFVDDAWWIEDSSRNGTILDDERLQKGVRHAIRVGQVIGLGESGPRYRVLSLEGRRVAETMMEAPSAPPPTPGPSTAPLKQGAAPPPQPAAPPPAPPPAEASTAVMRRSEAIRAGLNLPEESTEPMAPASDWVVAATLRETHSNQRWEVRGDVIKMGRAPECLVQIPPEQGASVSRVHAEIIVADGGIKVRDKGSRNGTFVNGKRLTEPHEARKGDLVMLGAGGPTFSLEDLKLVKGAQPAPVKTASAGAAVAGAALAGAAANASAEPPDPRKPVAVKKEMGPATNLARRSFAGVGRTAFFKDVLEDMSQKSARRVRVIVGISIGVTVVIAAILFYVTQSRVQQTELRMAEESRRLEARADSIRLAASVDADRLRLAFDSARTSSAPRAVLDSLRNALADATRRTGVLEEALTRARSSLNEQLAAGDAARRRAEEDLQRLRTEVSQAQSGGGRASLDSLRRMLRDAESKATEVANQLRAVRGADLANVATMNQSAVGLVTTYAKGGNSEGSGFAITPSGYFVTNRHVVQDDAGVTGDSVFVTMADNRYASPFLRADIVAVGEGESDLAILKIRNYRGPYVKKVDWAVRARQGEPAALIGFPRGVVMALDSQDTVRTTVTAGIFSKISPNRIQFDGFSQGGSSGSPVFNADGEVVAVHFAGLKGAVGLGFAVPASKIAPLLPSQAKEELGVR